MKLEQTIMRSAFRTTPVRLAGLGAVLALTVASAALADGPLVTSGSDERNWSMAYNSQQHEYLLGLSQSGVSVVQRIGSDGTPVGSPVAPWLAAGFYGFGEIQLVYNPHANQYLVVMSGQFPLPPSGQPVVFAAVLDANAALVGGPVILSYGNTSTSYDPNRHYRTINAAFNTLANEYLVTYQMTSLYSQRIAENATLPAGPSTVISGHANGSHAIAYGSVVSPETPQGRYLLVNFSPNAPHVEGLTMLGSDGQFLTNGLPFDWGVSYNPSGGGGEYSPDVVYAELPPPDGRKVFVVVWEDEDNYDYWNPGLVRRGVWGGWLPATILGYSEPPSPGTYAFYLDGDYYNPGPPFMWDPRITYDASTGLFYMVSRHTATNGFWCPAGTPLNYHISLMSFDGSGLAVEVYPAGSGDCNGTGFPVSAMTGTYPGDQLPRHPMLALGGPGKLLIAWDDARNQGSGGNQRDLYGTLILPPANDQCSGALPLVDNVYSAVSTTNATDDGTSTCLGVTRRKGVWFTYTPAQDGTATLDTCPSDFGTAVEVFTGTCGNLNSIGCTNNSPTCSVTNRASYSFPCTAGTTYMIWAGGNYGAFGNLQIRAHLVPGPSPNDDCTGAIALYENVYYSQSTVSATDDGESRCFKGMARYHGVWFTYTAPQTGVAAVDTCGTRYNNLIEVFTGPCATLHGISCFLGSAECVGNSGQNDCKFSCTAGTTYTICVSSTQGASGLLDVRARMVPANDQCDGAFALSDNVYYPENTATATDDGYSSCLGPRTKGVWFTYTPAASGTVIVDTVPSDFWPSVEFFTGTCSNLTSIGCNTNCAFCTGGDTSYLAGTAGTTYTICVGGYNGASGNLQIRAHSLAVPRAPRLVLTLVDTNTVGLTIYGDIGHVHDIQVNRSLSSPNWITLNSVTLTSDPQYFTLIRPANSAFWRAIAH